MADHSSPDQRKNVLKRAVEDDEPSNPTPKKRARPVVPEQRENRYNDGTPKPTKGLQDLVNKVVQTRYEYSPLGPGDDIRVLVLLPSNGDANSIVCRVETSMLPSSRDASLGGSVDKELKTLSYEALSYYWGMDDATIPITIWSYNKRGSHYSMGNIIQRRFWIRPNLHAALVHLRDEKDEVRLWVDAVCINQENIEEKTAQVARMHEIYSEASNVCVWLGVPDTRRYTGPMDPKTPKQAFDFIRELLGLKRLDQLITTDTLEVAEKWFSFAELMKNRWFSRRWVIQELALAKDATVHYGEEVMNWIDFADAVALFITKQDQINAIIKKHKPLDFDSIGDMRALGANTLVQASSNLFRRSNDGQIMERLMDLETLVSNLIAFEAKDPKDTVYAVLSVANDTPYSNSLEAARTVPSAVSTPAANPIPGDLRIMPNYDEAKSLADVFTDFVDYCVEQSESLDIICRHWAPPPKGRRRSITALTPGAHLTMPTWIPSVTGSAFGGPGLALQGRSNGDSLVGSPSRKHQTTYHASRGLRPRFHIDRNDRRDIITLPNQSDDEDRSSFSGGHTGRAPPTSSSQTRRRTGGVVLYARGVCLDTVKQLSPRAADGIIFRECLEMGGWHHHDPLDKLPDSLWRTLVADRGPDGVRAPSWYRRACLECFTNLTQNGDLSTGALMENQNTPSIMKTFLKRVQEVVWDRKFLRGDPDGKNLFGLAPKTAEVGDLICILFGCSVPVILRKMKDTDDEYYYLVGEAYIHGMMDGEALNKKTPEYPYEDSEDWVNFKIR